MKQTAQFGRREVARPRPAPSAEISLTPAQRAYLFGSESLLVKDLRAEPKPALRRRHASMVASLVTTIIVAGVMLIGKPHETIAALPPGLAVQAKAMFQRAGDGFGPLALVWSMLVIGSNLGANLWLTQKCCGWLGLATLPAFAATGAIISLLVAAATGLIGLGETEIGYLAEALSGGGAALLYRLLTRVDAVQPEARSG